MQEIRFGRIEGLRVRGGEPDWSEPPRIYRSIKLGRGNAAHPMLGMADFVLRAEVSELLGVLADERDVDVSVLEVVDGLPRHLVVASEARP
jgi:hypothetical protein